MALRIDDIARGFTPEADAQLPDCFLENKLRQQLHTASLDRQKGDHVEALLRARQRYLRVAAIALQLVDRVDFITTHAASTKEPPDNA